MIEIKKGDIEMLDLVLEYVLDQGTVTRHVLLNPNAYNIKKTPTFLELYPSSIASEEDFKIKIVPYFINYTDCGENHLYGHYIIKNDKTLALKAQGGFLGLYNRQEQFKQEKEKDERLKEAQYTLTQEQIKDIKRANKKSNWSLAIAILSIIVSVIISFYR